MTKHSASQQSMTRKEALAVLYHLHEDWIRATCYLGEYASESREALRRQSFQALHVLASTIHGRPGMEQFGVLCGICHLRYSTHDLFDEKHAQENICGFCCTSCYEQLKSERKLSQEEREEA